jgi:branched-chain amino acid transport system permease protein
MSTARFRRAEDVAGLAALLALVALPVVLSRFGRYFAAEIFTWALYAMGFNVCFGMAGMLSFGHAAFFAFGAYGATLSVLYLARDPWLALLAATVAAAALAALIGFFAVRVVSHSFVIITIIFSLVLLLLAHSQKDITGGDDGLTFTPLTLFGTSGPALASPLAGYYTALAFMVLGYLALGRLRRSPLGLVFLALRDNERRTLLVGYDVQRYKWLAFLLSGAVAGLAGGLYAITHSQVNAQLFDITVSVDAVIWTLIGGAGSVVGPAIGAALVLVFTDVVSGWLVYTQIPVGILLILIVLFFPTGLAGVWRAWRARRVTA